MKIEDTTLLDRRVDEARVGPQVQPLLRVEGLSVALALDAEREASPLRDVSFTVAPGEVLGVLGESGAGKSTMALALLQLLVPPLRICQGSIRLRDRDLMQLSERERRGVRGDEVSLIYQDSSVLHPMMRVGSQVSEVLRAHREWPKSGCDEQARRMLELVGLGESGIWEAYPHQLSGGQRQRVAIAQALVCEPVLVIADEPTAALDPVTSQEIVELFKSLKARQGVSFLVITHDPDVLAALADRVMVMYAGEVIEKGRAADVLGRPLHPYTRELLRCQIGSGDDAPITVAHPLEFIAGAPPNLMKPVVGCPFESRCSQRRDLCRACSPSETTPFASHTVRCFEYGGEA